MDDYANTSLKSFIIQLINPAMRLIAINIFAQISNTDIHSQILIQCVKEIKRKGFPQY